jgi:vacuolar-type H+-ATPase subunit F/Vma7
MSDRIGRVAVIGDQDLAYPLRTLGIQIYTPGHLEEARKILEELEQEDIVLCFLHQSYFEPLQEEREALGKKFTPVVVGFSDYRKIIDHLDEMMRDMAVKATGSASLVKRRGNHGTR